MVLRCNGREAVELLIEVDHGFHRDFTQEDIAYLKEQATGFYVYLRKQGVSEEDAKDIITNIQEDTAFEITHDWQDAFLLGREREDLLFEIYPAARIADEQNMEDLFNEDLENEIYFQERFEEIADRHAGKNPDEFWAKAKRFAGIIEDLLVDLEAKYPEGSQVTEEDKEFLNYLTFRLRRLRGLVKPWENVKKVKAVWRDEAKGIFVMGTIPVQTNCSVCGAGIWISASMWKGLQNRINRLLGNPKRYEMKVTKETEEEVMEVPGLVVYGLDVERCIHESEVCDPEEE